MKTIRFSTGFVAILLAISLTCQTHAQTGGGNSYIKDSRVSIELLVIVLQDTLDLADMAGDEQHRLAKMYPPLAQQLGMSGQYFHIGAGYASGSLNYATYLEKNWDSLTRDQREKYAKAGKSLAEQAFDFINLGQRITPIRTSTGGEAWESAIDVEQTWEMIIALL
jgi:hypothetical protein